MRNSSARYRRQSATHRSACDGSAAACCAAVAAQARTALQAALQGRPGSLTLLDEAIDAARLSSLDAAMVLQLLNAREHMQARPRSFLRSPSVRAPALPSGYCRSHVHVG
jgi:hypothetical protein